MLNVARVGDIVITGHDCADRTTIQVGGAAVYVNGRNIAVRGSKLTEHAAPENGVCGPHTAFVNSGSTSVYASGAPVARLGDSADLGAIDTASTNVYAG